MRLFRKIVGYENSLHFEWVFVMLENTKNTQVQAYSWAVFLKK
ncbi:hypothetical protein C943_03929 [Mariniradius saccharolyticus AK6]|uniref:Uncharacterized protein n=1 Tax=Mariniradius saccharolyticus AK6 TaxID=1239962 RepID=M7Y023_9BACT|nr:hypothetical protein C943_03929 [Mariniradius saccharolyticus AK6]